MRARIAKFSVSLVLGLAGILTAPSSSTAWYFPWSGGCCGGPYTAGYYGGGYYGGGYYGGGYYPVGFYGVGYYGGNWPGYAGGCCGGCPNYGYPSSGCASCGCAPCGCSPCGGGCYGSSVACAGCSVPSGTSADCWNATPAPATGKPPKPIPEDGNFRSRTPPTYDETMPPNREPRPRSRTDGQREPGAAATDGSPVPQPKEPDTQPKKFSREKGVPGDALPDLPGADPSLKKETTPDFKTPAPGKTPAGDSTKDKDAPDLFDGKLETNKPQVPVQQRKADKKAPASQIPDEDSLGGGSTAKPAAKSGAASTPDAAKDPASSGVKSPNEKGNSAGPSFELQDRPTWRYTGARRQIDGRIAGLSAPVPGRLRSTSANWVLLPDDSSMARR